MTLHLLTAVLVAVSLQAAAQDASWGRRNQSGSINYAPLPGVFVVVDVDDYESTVKLRARNGATADVVVDDRVYDVSTLKPGDLVQVDFLVPNDNEDAPAAATIWPLR